MTEREILQLLYHGHRYCQKRRQSCRRQKEQRKHRQLLLPRHPRHDSNAESKNSDELKALASTLGEAFITAPADINDGYPIFRWQIPTYTVTFTVNSADAEVTIDGQTGTHSGSNWTFALPDGEYDYTVSAFGYGAKYGKVTVNGSAVSEPVTLSAVEKRTVTLISPRQILMPRSR